MPDIAGPFKDVFVCKFSRDNGPFRGRAGDRVDHIAHFHVGDVHPEDLAIGIVDIHPHLAVIDHLLRICGEVDLDHLATRLEHLQFDGFRGGIGQHVVQA